MSSSPVNPDWLDESMPLPQAGLIWPWIMAGAMLFIMGLYLLYPTTGPERRPKPAPSLASATPGGGSSPAFPEDGKSLNFLFVDSTASSFAAAAEELKRALGNTTTPPLQMRLFPSGQYHGRKLDELSIIEEVRKGNAQMGLTTSSPLTNFVPDFEVFDLPFLIENYEQADEIFMGPIGDKMLDSLKAQGLVGLGYWEVGFRVFSSSVPLPTLAHFRGKRVRVMQSATAIAMGRQLDCEPVPSPVDRIMPMIREGFIDAADRTYPTYWDFQLYEVHRYITESRHSYTMKVIIMNKDAYERLSAEQKKALHAAVDKVEAEQRRQQRLEDQRVKQECRRMGIQIFELSPDERRRFLEACKPLYDEYVKLRGSEVLTAVRKITMRP